jgi:hypothetical protein
MTPEAQAEFMERIAIIKARACAASIRLIKSESSFTPPDGVRSAARRGLELREKWKRGGITNSEASAEGIGSGVQRATNLKNGDAISLATVKRMAAFFSRHQKNYRPDEKEADGGPTAGTIAWLLWGGNAGKSWAQGVLNRVEKMGPDAGDVHVPTATAKNPKAKKKAYRQKGNKAMKNTAVY